MKTVIRLNIKYKYYLLIVIVQLLGSSLLFTSTGQQTTAKNADTLTYVDLNDVFRKIFKKEKKPPPPLNAQVASILPTLGYNPSFGFILGLKLVAGKQLGNPQNTNYSIFGIEGFISTEKILSIQARHNLFLPENKWNWQGHWQLSRLGLLDYGLGTGSDAYRGRGFNVNDLPTENGDSANPIQYTYVRLFEKAYRKIGANLYAGAGVSFELFSNIDDLKKTDTTSTPHHRYSLQNDFNPEKYNANGFLFALQYNTREHPNRSYGGIFADLSIQFNQTWLGSTKNAIRFMYDFRKYWSLSKRSPEHVLALWLWASYAIDGELPYLALPATASDTYGRSGRGYTLGSYRGPSYAYFETEYRFPITHNKFLSGVCFLNMQTASDNLQENVFGVWEPGGGAGLRILFQKQSRTTLCIDFAKGASGSSGVFFGLNEVF